MCGYEGQNILLVLDVIVLDETSTSTALTVTHCRSVHEHFTINTGTLCLKKGPLKNSPPLILISFGILSDENFS